MKQLLINIFLGMLPEALFFTMFLICSKKIKEKRIILFILIVLNYIGTGVLNTYSIYSYVLFIILQYTILKLLYKEKTEWIDVFLVTISHIYLFIIAISCYKVFSDYKIALLVNRLLLLVPFIFRNKLNYLYEEYRKLWNRNSNNKIKSITLRNISLIFLNIFIFASDLVCIYISNI